MCKLQYWVYILLCDNGSYYTGYTSDLERRYQEHVSGTGKCKYTRSFKPIRIAQSWCIEGDKSLAMRVERLIKKMTKNQKDMIISHPRCDCITSDNSSSQCKAAKSLLAVIEESKIDHK